MEPVRACRPMKPEDEEEERRHINSIINTFKMYRFAATQKVDKTELYLNTLPAHHRSLLTNYRLNLLRQRSCIDTNSKIVLRMIEDVDKIFEEEPTDDNNCYHRIHKHLRTAADEAIHPQPHLDTDRVIITLKQIVRDWSVEGKEERNQCYKPILDALEDYFKDFESRGEVKILVPGAGLGRLTYEIAYRGFYCEGNEFSYFMLIAANFILNKCLYDNQYTFYPWVHQSVNNLRASDQTRSATFPDVSAIQRPPKGGAMNMVAGDFLQVYTQNNYWDGIATSFFIDCANNVIDFVEAIYNILKPGGVWINLGPLLYHYSDSDTENSIEPTYEDLIEIVKAVGFEILRNETNIPTKYTQNTRSMYQSTYTSIFLVCRKAFKAGDEPLQEEEDIE